MRKVMGGVVAVALIAAACSTTNETREVVVLPDYAAQVAELPLPPNDRSLPDISPEGPVGAYGYSRYVYQRQGDQIVATLIEGPLGHQVRCQQLAQECSYVELQAIYDAGGEIPDYLEMNRGTLGELLGQLARVEAAVLQYETLDDACAAGLSISSAQTSNMGTHVTDAGAGFAFNPDRPQLTPFADDGG